MTDSWTRVEGFMFIVFRLKVAGKLGKGVGIFGKPFFRQAKKKWRSAPERHFLLGKMDLVKVGSRP
jgi:hypothetical protein